MSNRQIFVAPNNATDSKVKDLTTEQIKALVKPIAEEVDIDATQLATALDTWNKMGIPLKHTIDGNALSVYVDKEFAAPYVAVLLPALGTLDKTELHQIANKHS